MWKNGTTKRTAIGFVNRNEQRCCGHRGVNGTDHGQKAYKIECLWCGNDYGANGTAIFERKCPKCQKGDPGIPY